VNYKFKSGFLYTFGKDLKKFGVHVEALSSNEDNFTLYLLSKDEKKITKYIKYISKEYFKNIKNIDIKRIEIDDKDFSYRGVLKVEYK
jgi:O-glycosyl hydrolase